MYDTLLWACKILSLQFHTISATFSSNTPVVCWKWCFVSGWVISCHIMSCPDQDISSCVHQWGMGYTLDLWPFGKFVIGKFVHLHGILWGTFSNKFVSTSPPSRLRSGCVKMLFEFLHHSRYSSATSRIRLKFPQTAGNDEASRCSHSRTFMTLLEGFDPPQRYIMIHIIYIYT